MAQSFMNMIKTGNFNLTSKHNQKPFIADARYIGDGQSKPVIVFVHGFKGFKDWGHFDLIADFFVNSGFVFLKMNLSHNGTTPESPIDFVDLEAFSDNNFSIELDDIGVLIDQLFDQKTPIPSTEMDLKQLNLIGHSRGGALVLLKAAQEDRVSKVTAWSPIHNFLERWSPDVLERWEKEGVHHILNGRTNQNMPLKYQLVEDMLNQSERLDVAAAVKSMKKPVFLLHGTGDETLHYSHTVELAKTNPEAHIELIDHADHVFGGSHPFMGTRLPDHTQQILDLTLSFLK